MRGGAAFCFACYCGVVVESDGPNSTNQVRRRRKAKKFLPRYSIVEFHLIRSAMSRSLALNLTMPLNDDFSTLFDCRFKGNFQIWILQHFFSSVEL